MAYTIAFYIIIILIGGLLSIGFSVPVNELIDFINSAIFNQEVSKSFTGYFNFLIGLLIAAPLLLLISATIWAIVRGIETRKEEL